MCSCKVLFDYLRISYNLCHGFVDTDLMLCLCDCQSKGTEVRLMYMNFPKGSENWKQYNNKGTIS